MKRVLVVALLLSSAFLLAQNSDSTNQTQGKDSNGKTVITGCVSQFGGDYTLMKENPAITYELQATGKIRLKDYLGNRVEVKGKQSPSLSTSSDATDRAGSPAPTTITVTSIKVLDKNCSERSVSR